MRAPNQAIIFAAGKGSRLGHHTKDLPKTLLNIGNLTIFDRIIIGLDRIGIRDVIVVTGYAGAKLQSHALSVSSRLAKNQLNFEFIMNNDLDIGNIYSFWLAREKMMDDFILLNSDVVFDYRILDLLKNNNHTSALVVDNFRPLGREEMKVKFENELLVRYISKDLDPLTANGEYIGIMKMTSDTARQVTLKVEQLMRQRKFPLYYEDAFKLVAEEQDCFFACSTEGLPWTEIDTIEDMNYARSIIMPQIENLA